jgi:hypothetical protein
MSKDRDKDEVFAGDDVPVALRDQDDNDPTVGAPKASTELGSGYNGQGAAAEPYASVSSVAEATADFNTAFSTMFGTKAPKALINAYASELIALQSGRSNKATKSKSGTNIVIQGVSAQERQNILNKYLTQYATTTISAATAGDVKAQAALQKGNFGLTYTTLKNAYYENGLPVNFKSLAQLTADSAINPEKLKANMNLINMQAKTYFPALADKIDKGYTVKQLLSPYIQTRANILEEDPDSVDIASLSNVAKDPKGLMGLYDYEVSLRKDPKWRFTKNAQDSLSNVARSIAQTFGLVG